MISRIFQKKNDMILEMMKEKIDDDVRIEIMDKEHMADDGIDIKDIYEDDFRLLKHLLYNDVEYIIDKLRPVQVRDLLDYIDMQIEESISYVKYNIIYRKEGSH